jgi:DNA-binding MarR family transcriptional regulator
LPASKYNGDVTSRAQELNEEVVARLRGSVLRLARELRTRSAEEGLTPTQSGVLATLVRQGPMRAGELAAGEALNPTMLSRVLVHLEDAGLIVRRPDPHDRRGAWAEATPAGRRLIRRLRARHGALLAARLGELDAEDLAAVLAALPALEALAGGGAPAAGEPPARPAAGARA